MSCPNPDRQTIEIALGLAVRAPSVHNSQPWRWRIDSEGMHLFADTDRHLTATDPFQRALVISCGTTLHHLRVALTALGWATTVDRCPDPGVPEYLAVVHPTPALPTNDDIDLAAAILLRRTDRRRYLCRPIPARYVRAMATRVSALGAAIRQVPDRMLPLLARPMREAVIEHAIDREYQDEIATWSGRVRGTDGVPSQNTPPPRPGAEIPLRTFARPTLIDPLDAPDGAQWLLIGTAYDDRAAQLRAGEATSVLLLTATSLGLATSLQTEPLGLPELRREIQTSLLHNCAYPQTMVRVGWSPRTSAPLADTPRRSIEEILEI